MSLIEKHRDGKFQKHHGWKGFVSSMSQWELMMNAIFFRVLYNFKTTIYFSFFFYFFNRRIKCHLQDFVSKHQYIFIEMYSLFWQNLICADNCNLHSLLSPFLYVDRKYTTCFKKTLYEHTTVNSIHYYIHFLSSFDGWSFAYLALC